MGPSILGVEGSAVSSLPIRVIMRIFFVYRREFAVSSIASEIQFFLGRFDPPFIWPIDDVVFALLIARMHNSNRCRIVRPRAFRKKKIADIQKYRLYTEPLSDNNPICDDLCVHKRVTTYIIKHLTRSFRNI